MSRARKTHEALERLAGLYRYGGLHLDTDPAGFLGMVCEELEALRGVQEAAAKKRADCWSGHRLPYWSGSDAPSVLEPFDDTPEGIKRALDAHAAFAEKWGEQS